MQYNIGNTKNPVQIAGFSKCSSFSVSSKSKTEPIFDAVDFSKKKEEKKHEITALIERMNNRDVYNICINTTEYHNRSQKLSQKQIEIDGKKKVEAKIL